MIKQYLYRLIFLQIRFDVDIDLRPFPESGFERFFHLCGDVVRFDDRRIGVDFDVSMMNVFPFLRVRRWWNAMTPGVCCIFSAIFCSTSSGRDISRSSCMLGRASL